MGRKMIDLTDKRFGRLLVIKLALKRGNVRWVCVCNCGNKIVVYGHNLTGSKTVSCGCLQKENRIKHGMIDTPEYESWRHMRQRCTNKTSGAYKNYGGRGITICKRWNSFEKFRQDMGPKPTVEHTIERIDNNGNYTHSNCCWATRKEQAQNRRPKSKYKKKK